MGWPLVLTIMAGFSIHCLCWQSLWQELLLVYNTLAVGGGMVITTDHMVKVQTADEQMESLHCRQMVMAMIVDSLHILGDWEHTF